MSPLSARASLQNWKSSLCSISPFCQLPFTPGRKRGAGEGRKEGGKEGEEGGEKGTHPHTLFSHSLHWNCLAVVIRDLRVVKSSECLPVFILPDLSMTLDIAHTFSWSGATLLILLLIVHFSPSITGYSFSICLLNVTVPSIYDPWPSLLSFSFLEESSLRVSILLPPIW